MWFLLITFSTSGRKPAYDLLKQQQQQANKQKNPYLRITPLAHVALLYVKNERSEREIKETISFGTTSRRTKYLGINNLRRQKTCPLETKMLMKEI